MLESYLFSLKNPSDSKTVNDDDDDDDNNNV